MGNEDTPTPILICFPSIDLFLINQWKAGHWDLVTPIDHFIGGLRGEISIKEFGFTPHVVLVVPHRLPIGMLCMEGRRGPVYSRLSVSPEPLLSFSLMDSENYNFICLHSPTPGTRQIT